MGLGSFQRLLSLFLAILSLGYVTANFDVPWSSDKFGPDGPWQAVRITVGGNDSSLRISAQNTSDLSVYPGGTWECTTFTSTYCEDFPDSTCGAGGAWDPDLAQAAQQHITFQADWIDDSSGINVRNASRIILGLTIAGTTAWNASLVSATDGNISYPTFPNGIVSGVPLGKLPLGAVDTYQIFTLGNKVSQEYHGYLFNGWMYESRKIASYSYGLHIGSAAFKYPGSLVFGGYNKGRVIEPVTSFTDFERTDLLDISIGTADGASPFNFTSKEKLLSTGPVSVAVRPLSPYLSLPRATCDNLAQLLPVTFDSGLKYYLWNTEDPLYKKIVSSPAYIGFTFPPATGSTDNVIIKVPFALLNLTLEHPITESGISKQYFPCVPLDDNLVLGRAFLQAAFIGRNWRTKLTWLAQAPGPGVSRRGLGDQNIDIPDDATTISGFTGPNLFVESWKGQWSLIQSQEPSPPSPPSPPGNVTTTQSTPSNLSTGAKIGIGIGAALGVIVVFCALVWSWRRHRAGGRTNTVLTETGGNNINTTQHSHQEYNEWVARKPTSEMPVHFNNPIEAPDTSIANSRH